MEPVPFLARVFSLSDTERNEALMEHLLAVDDFAELADVMPESADTVYVAGHRSPGDGGAGVFRWLVDSRETTRSTPATVS